MKRAVKIGGSLLLALVAVAALAAAAAELLSQRKLNRTITVQVADLPVAVDTTTVARGKYLFEAVGCIECHGANGGGKVFIDDPAGMYVRAPNLTSGPGSAVSAYTGADWVRTIRHGVKPGGKPALVMPSEDYNRLSDADVAAIVAYVRQMPPVIGEPAAARLPLIVKALYAAGVVKDAAEKIDHTLPPHPPVAPGATMQQGAYLANTCIGCHTASFAGGKVAGTPPDWPAAGNLTSAPGSAMQHYTSPEQFKSMIRTGRRPDGSEVSKVMPFAALRNYSDTDLEALYLFFKSLPPKSTPQ
ncbi:MAG TPA: c-type cytochrome [Burkholderiaceae bacterium]